MSIRFLTKEESNREREQAFLALSGPERLQEWLALSRRILREYPSSEPRDYGNNLVLIPPDPLPGFIDKDKSNGVG